MVLPQVNITVYRCLMCVSIQNWAIIIYAPKQNHYAQLCSHLFGYHYAQNYAGIIRQILVRGLVKPDYGCTTPCLCLGTLVLRQKRPDKIVLWKFEYSNCLSVSPGRVIWQMVFINNCNLLIDLTPQLRTASHTTSHPTSCATFATRSVLSVSAQSVTLSQSWRWFRS